MIHAYDEIYLDDAKETLGSALEYAVLFCGIDGQEFLDLFVTCGIAAEFGRGNVKFISGMSGSELARLILERCGKRIEEYTELDYIDYPPEYWVGWILAHYQWYSGKSFHAICSSLKYDALINMYSVLHEADPSKAIQIFNNIMEEETETSLARLRKAQGLSQSQLAMASGVSIRAIQLYEQRRADIHKAQYNHLLAIANALGCSIRDIVEV